MEIQGIATLSLWVILSFILAYILHKKFSFFRKLRGITVLLALFILFVLSHNAIYGLFGIEEAVFFILSFLALGSAALLALIQLFRKIFS